ncbi:MAG: hypothetical protein WCO98_12340, partial [bacterium]
VIYNILQKLNKSYNWFGGHPEITRTINSISQVKDGLSPKFLLDKSSELKLSAIQKENILKLQQKYNASIAKAKNELEIQIKKYQDYSKNKPVASKIEEMDKEISRISAIIVTTRAYYWNEACKILKKEQTTILDKISNTISPAERSKYR